MQESRRVSDCGRACAGEQTCFKLWPGRCKRADMFQIVTGRVQESRHVSYCGRACAGEQICFKLWPGMCSWLLFHFLKCFNCVLLQSLVETLPPATAFDPSRCGPLQCPDEPVPHPSEVGSDVHGHQQQHRPCLSTEGLWEVNPVPEGHQSPEAGQVGHQSDCCVPSSGKFINQSDQWAAWPRDLLHPGPHSGQKN